MEKNEKMKIEKRKTKNEKKKKEKREKIIRKTKNEKRKMRINILEGFEKIEQDLEQTERDFEYF